MLRCTVVWQLMSQMGHSRRFEHPLRMSAFAPIATDRCSAVSDLTGSFVSGLPRQRQVEVAVHNHQTIKRSTHRAAQISESFSLRWCDGWNPGTSGYPRG